MTADVKRCIMPFPLQIIYSTPPRVYSLNLKVQALNIVELANSLEKKKTLCKEFVTANWQCCIFLRQGVKFITFAFSHEHKWTKCSYSILLVLSVKQLNWVQQCLRMRFWFRSCLILWIQVVKFNYYSLFIGFKFPFCNFMAHVIQCSLLVINLPFP